MINNYLPLQNGTVQDNQAIVFQWVRILIQLNRSRVVKKLSRYPLSSSCFTRFTYLISPIKISMDSLLPWNRNAVEKLLKVFLSSESWQLKKSGKAVVFDQSWYAFDIKDSFNSSLLGDEERKRVLHSVGIVTLGTRPQPTEVFENWKITFKSWQKT